jgi:uncharacterized protein
MIKQVELILPPEEAANEQVWKKSAARLAGIELTEVTAFITRKESIDSRSRKILVRKIIDVISGDSEIPDFQKRKWQNVKDNEPVVIIGCGPAGLFAAIRLIENGFKPIIIERGKDVRQRRHDLAVLNRQRAINADSNYCFGEGGAGTYSDGKLYTRSGKRGNIQQVLDTFIEFGASPEIGYQSHPHIGTNKLPGIISAIRQRIAACGGEVIFNHRVTGFNKNGNQITGLRCIDTANPSAEISIQSNSVILSTGHSSRDIFECLHDEKIAIEAKPYSIGIRIEHPQKLIDNIQYHCDSRGDYLPPAAYTLSSQANGRGVYSFCMCPGGIIAVASTSPGEVVVNGWSPSKRNNPFANSGIVVSVDEPDFLPYKKYGALSGLRLQQAIERKAFIAGGSDLTAPAQRMMDFIDRKNSTTLPPCSYIPGLKAVMLDDVLTPAITASLREGFKIFASKMKGFVTNEAVLVAPESRTSSPVKIPRHKETLMHPDVTGFFPCGEGAGYAGGIMSAAMDGERVADACVKYRHHS